jgi:hypothetical protein
MYESLAMAGAASTSGGIAPTEALPQRSPSLDAASFDRLLSQAQEQQATVEFSNPQQSMAHQSVGAVTRSISQSSQEYTSSVRNAMTAVSNIDPANPKSFTDAVAHFSASIVKGIELSVVLGEVSNGKKSLQELFHTQG